MSALTHNPSTEKGSLMHPPSQDKSQRHEFHADEKDSMDMKSPPSSASLTSSLMSWLDRPSSISRIATEAGVILAAYFLIRFYGLPTILLHKQTLLSFWENSIVKRLTWTRDFLALYTLNERGKRITFCDPQWKNPVHTEIGRLAYHVQSKVLGLADDHTLALVGPDPAGWASVGGYVVLWFYYNAVQAWFVFGFLGGPLYLKKEVHFLREVVGLGLLFTFFSLLGLLPLYLEMIVNCLLGWVPLEEWILG